MSTQLQNQLAKVRKALDGYPIFQRVEDKIQVPKEYIAAGVVPVVLLGLFLGGGMRLISNLAGFVYPAYMSVGVIERSSSNKNASTQWLTYWVIYALFTVLEVFRNFLPHFWYSMKLGILVWAMLPQTQGAAFIYSNFLKDFISSTETRGPVKEAKKDT
eukprot:8008_1